MKLEAKIEGNRITVSLPNGETLRISSAAGEDSMIEVRCDDGELTLRPRKGNSVLIGVAK